MGPTPHPEGEPTGMIEPRERRNSVDGDLEASVGRVLVGGIAGSRSIGALSPQNSEGRGGFSLLGSHELCLKPPALHGPAPAAPLSWPPLSLSAGPRVLYLLLVPWNALAFLILRIMQLFLSPQHRPRSPGTVPGWPAVAVTATSPHTWVLSDCSTLKAAPCLCFLP